MTPQMTEATTLRDKIRETVNLPYVSTSIMTLGGEDRPSVAIKVSFDERATWVNGIIENSRYATILFHFSREGGGKISAAGSCHTLKSSIRQAKFKNADDALRLLQKWVAAQTA